MNRPHRLTWVLLAALCIVPLASPAQAPATAAPLRAGAHAQDISPTKFPISVNGGMKDRQATGVHDPMMARCLALDDGKHPLILCVVDACVVPREVCEQAKEIVARETKVPKSHLLISATHTHTAATLVSVFQSDPNPEYLREVPARIAAGMVQAYRNLEPAEVAFGFGSDPEDVFNRRWHVKPGKTVENPFGELTDRVQMNPGASNPNVSVPAGPVDQQVGLLAARSVADGRPLALLVNYSLHYVGGFPEISADYFGAFANLVAERLETRGPRYEGKPAFVGILSNGTSGDINNVNYGLAQMMRAQPGEQIAKVTANLADATLTAYRALKWEKTLVLDSEERDLQLGVRKANPQQLAQAQEWLTTIPKDRDGQWGNRKAIYARETVALSEWPDTVPVKLQIHRIGGLSLGAIPCETFVEIGLHLKKVTPFARHFTIELANGYNGYLPTPEHHALGGYETWRARSSYLETQASTKIVQAMEEMFAALQSRAK